MNPSAHGQKKGKSTRFLIGESRKGKHLIIATPTALIGADYTRLHPVYLAISARFSALNLGAISANTAPTCGKRLWITIQKARTSCAPNGACTIWIHALRAKNRPNGRIRRDNSLAGVCMTEKSRVQIHHITPAR